MEQQEYLMKLSMIEQEAAQLQEKMQVMDEQIQDFGAIKTSLGEIEKTGKDQKLLANLGKGIFIETEIKDKELLVNVGKNVIVKKSPQETVIILEDQIKKLTEGKEKIMQRVEAIQGEMQAVIAEAQAQQQNNEK